MSHMKQLRAQIEAIDVQLIELIAKRLGLAVQVGQQKKKMGAPIRDWSIEKQVIERAHRTAHRFHLPTELVRNIMQLLIQESCAFQEGLRNSSYNGDLGHIFIVGGKGRMGKWFARFFHNQGHSVSIHDTAGALPDFPYFQNLADGIAQASLILLTTPLDETPRVYEQLIRLRPLAIICDIASLKSGLLESVRKAKEAHLRVASIHPLFGPDARMLSDKVICLCDCGDRTSLQEVRALFQETSAKLVELPIERHDFLTSYVLGLSHIVNIIFAHTLLKSGVTYKTLSEVASTTFIRQIATTISVVAESPFLYYEIQKGNAFTPELYRQLSAAMNEIFEAALSKNQGRFVDIMEKSRKYFKGDEGMRESLP
jgi:chorismate mutase/prephenate dehydrogenase